MTTALKAAVVVAVVAALARSAAAPTTVDRADPGVVRANGVLSVGGTPFTGVLTEHDAQGRLRVSTRYRDGLRDGAASAWYEDGQLRYKRAYSEGRETGHHRGWWPNGVQRFDYHFEGGVLQGRAREWLRDGTLYKEFHYVDGHEEGSQRMWNDDGTLRANYVVRAGRRYGLMGSKGCVQDDGPDAVATVGEVIS